MSCPLHRNHQSICMKILPCKMDVNLWATEPIAIHRTVLLCIHSCPGPHKPTQCIHSYLFTLHQHFTVRVLLYCLQLVGYSCGSCFVSTLVFFLKPGTIISPSLPLFFFAVQPLNVHFVLTPILVSIHRPVSIYCHLLKNLLRGERAFEDLHISPLGVDIYQVSGGVVSLEKHGLSSSVKEYHWWFCSLINHLFGSM